MLLILVFILSLRKYSSREFLLFDMCGRTSVSFWASGMEMRIKNSVTR